MAKPTGSLNWVARQIVVTEQRDGTWTAADNGGQSGRPQFLRNLRTPADALSKAGLPIMTTIPPSQLTWRPPAPALPTHIVEQTRSGPRTITNPEARKDWIRMAAYTSPFELNLNFWRYLEQMWNLVDDGTNPPPYNPATKYPPGESDAETDPRVPRP